MLQELDYLRELNIWSVMLRLTVAMVFGGLIGLERGRKGRAAGFRTYMVVCLGAVLQGMGNRMAFDFAIKCPRCKAIGGISFERSRMPLMFMSHTGRLPRYAFYNLAPHRVVVLAEDVKI